MKKKSILGFVSLAICAMVSCGYREDEKNNEIRETEQVRTSNELADDMESVSVEMQESSEEAMSEKVNLAELDIYWSLSGQGYEIQFAGKETDDCYRILLKDETGVKELLTYPRDEYTEPSDFFANTFDNLMGCTGFSVYNESDIFTYGYYYVIDRGELVCIAEDWCPFYAEHESYVVDVDNDGVTELLCNVTFGDGAMDTIIYRRNGAQILSGSCSDLLDEEFDNLSYASSYARYIPEEEVVEIHYWIEAVEDFKSKKYEINLDKINYWSEFAELSESIEIAEISPVEPFKIDTQRSSETSIVFKNGLEIQLPQEWADKVEIRPYMRAISVRMKKAGDLFNISFPYKDTQSNVVQELLPWEELVGTYFCEGIEYAIIFKPEVESSYPFINATQEWVYEELYAHLDQVQIVTEEMEGFIGCSVEETDWIRYREDIK